MSESKNINFYEDILLTSSKYLNQREYWTNKIDSDLANTELFSLKNNIPLQQESDGIIELPFDDPICNWIMELSFANDITIYIILMTGLKALLHCYVNNDDVNVVSPVFDPNISDYTINTHVYLCDRVSGDMTFKELLLGIRQSTLDAYENQDYPAAKLIEYIFGDSLGEVTHFISDIGCFLEEIHGNKNLVELNCSIAFFFKRVGDTITGKIIYDTRVYQKNSIQRMSHHYLKLMRHAMEKIDVRLADISILSDSEKKQLLIEFNNHSVEFPQEKNIYQYIEDYAQKVPENIAIGFENEEWSYLRLNQCANQLAHNLRNIGIGEDKPVGILMSRSPIMVVSILAVWKSGGAYIPMDIHFPISRIILILNDSATDVLITKDEHANTQLKTAYSGNIITVDSKFTESSGQTSTFGGANLDLTISMKRLAYIIYTSGSTGKPKGAMVEHIGMMNHIYAKINDLQLSGKSVVSQNASHTFDISVWQFFVALVVGGKTVIYPEQLILQPDRFVAQLIQDQITIFEVVPSYLSVILASVEEKNPPPLTIEYLLVTGEEVKPHLIKKWFQIYPNIKVVNAYGPTEASDDITHFIMARPPDMSRIPIGEPVQNMNIYIVDDAMRLCPLGVKGEICVSGIGVGRGYLNDAAKTSLVFMTDPFSTGKLVRLYKTGDLGRWLPDGSIEFYGRKDYQVKIRGFRIELEEIEKQILNYGFVKEAVVIDKEDKQGGKYLCAYMTGKENLNIPELKDFLSKQLPEYMVPTFLLQLDKIPLTPNGKIDRKALPEPSQSQQPTIQYITLAELEELKNAKKNKTLLLSSEDKEIFFKNVQVDLEKERFLAEEYSIKFGKKYYPLSHVQKMMYYTEIRYPETGCYNICGRGKYSELVDMKCLEKAINMVLEKNEGLRLRIAEVNDEGTQQAFQYVSEHKDHTFDFFDFSGKDKHINQEEWIDINTSKPFQFFDCDLFYFACIIFNEKESGYFIKVHHIVSDGWTFSLILAEIDSNYRNLMESNLIPDEYRPSYLQYLDDEKEYLNSDRFNDDIEYWYNAVYPIPETWSLADKIGDPTNIESRTIFLKLPVDLSIKIIEYCRTNSSSLFRLVLAAFSIYISTTVGLDDFTVGTVAHGRYKKNHRRMAGGFINFFPIRLNIAPNETFDKFVNQICNTQIFSSLRHQKLPFNILAVELREFADVDIRDLMSINIVDDTAVEVGGLHTDHYFPKHDPTPLSIHINPSKNKVDDAIEFSWTFQLENFTEPRIHDIHKGLVNILNIALENPEKKLVEIEFDTDKSVSEKINIKNIASLLLNYDSIEEAEVLIKKDWTDNPFIWAYVVAGKKLLESELKEYLSTLLSADMIPSFFVQFEKMPLTANGKADRNLLKTITMDAPKDFEAPRDAVEEKLTEICQEILGIDKSKISVEANFFEIGGHSLKAISLVTKIHKVFDVKIPLAEIFQTPVIRKMGQYIKESKADKYFSINPVEKKEYYPLSSAQKRLYILQQMDLNSTAYNIPEFITLHEEIDKKKLEETFGKLIKRHESLRTSFHMSEDRLIQKIHEKVEFTIEHFYDSNIHKFLRPFELSTAPLLRVGFAKIEETNLLLLLDMHHIISDGISHQVLRRDFMSFYNGVDLPDLRIQYKDFSEWHNSEKERERQKEQEIHWIKEFEGDIPILNLPLDYSRPMIQSFTGDLINSEIFADDIMPLRTLVSAEGCTLFIGLLACFNILLSRLSNMNDIIIGTPIAGRRHADLEKIIGMFVNTLALRNYPAGEKTFKEFLSQVKGRAIDAFENQEYQFENLVEKVDADRDASRNPLFDVMFVLQSINILTAEEIKKIVHDPTQQIQSPKMNQPIIQTSIFDLTLIITDTGNGLGFSIQYCTRLFKKETIQRFIIYLQRIILSITKNPCIKLQHIDILSEKEKQQLLIDFNQTEAAFPIHKTIHQLFEEQSQRTPDRIALIGETLSAWAKVGASPRGCTGIAQCHLTYAQLNKTSTQLSNYLLHQGVTSDSIVGIMIERSIEMVIGIMGILKAGGAYLPLSPSNPKERIDYMLKDSGAKTTLIFSEIAEIMALNLTDFLTGDMDTSALQIDSSNLAYIIYTSGSTGKPKGVMVEHLSVINTLSTLHSLYPFKSSDVYLLKTAYTFDVSVAELFGWYLGGGQLAILTEGSEKDPHEIVKAIVHFGVTHINFVPSMFNLIIEILKYPIKEKLTCLKYIFLAGEVLLPDMVKKFRALNSTIALENIYGPTEATVYTSKYSLVDWEDGNILPIGKPLPNLKLYILNSDFQLQPIGVSGELCIGGIGLARGYSNRPELTAEKFLNNFFISAHGKSDIKDRLYRTGDLVRWLSDGNIEFLGRIDDQVKVRGFRVEMGEIENCLLKYPGIKEAVVLARGDEGGEKYLTAYIVSDSKYEETEIREFLLKGLPDYMVPSYFVPLDQIPLSSSGKVDRKALPRPELKAGLDYVAPRYPTEAKLVGLWVELLNIQPEVISIDSNFFHLGGHSLKATVMISILHKMFDVSVPLVEVFKTPTIRGMAKYIDNSGKNKYLSIEAIEKKEYYPLSSAQKRLYFLQSIEPSSTGYNMPFIFPGAEELHPEKLGNIFQELINRHESLRTSFHMIENHPVQKVHEDIEFNIALISGGKEENMAFAASVRPFDLSHAPLLRVGLLKRNDGRHMIMIDMHHIITDGISMELLKIDFMALYEGKNLPRLRIHYKDFAQWQNSPSQQEMVKKQEEYWLKEFAGEIPVLKLSTGHENSGESNTRGCGIKFGISKEDTSALKKLALEEGATLYMILLTIYNLFLSKVSGQQDIIIGTPSAGRRHADLKQIIGMFVNTLALRNYPSEEKTFKDFFKEVKERTLKAFENQDYQFEDLVANVLTERVSGKNPIFDVMFIMQNQMETGSGSQEINEPIPYKADEIFDLLLSAVESEEILILNLVCRAGVCDDETIERFSRYFKEIIRAILENNHIKIKDIKISHRLFDQKLDIPLEEEGDFTF